MKLKISSDFLNPSFALLFLTILSQNVAVHPNIMKQQPYGAQLTWKTVYILIKLQFNNDSSISYSADGLSLAQDEYKQC